MRPADRAAVRRSTRSCRVCPCLTSHMLAPALRPRTISLGLRTFSAPFTAVSVTQADGPPPSDSSLHDDHFEPSPIYFGRHFSEGYSFLARQLSSITSKDFFSPFSYYYCLCIGVLAQLTLKIISNPSSFQVTEKFRLGETLASNRESIFLENPSCIRFFVSF
ncbi:hypothetical protein Salat_2513900 [Sesamum alatum]|uniref:Uncharacterized protein n=1 Tax=Sesamum alatum TaxID=300844 RepID=A0AAE2CCA4_9LAMI|nr:hypothetical protein Salat_2513900 [Sesamum alatum]